VKIRNSCKLIQLGEELALCLGQIFFEFCSAFFLQIHVWFWCLDAAGKKAAELSKCIKLGTNDTKESG
jgi:hypothetical protein